MILTNKTKGLIILLITFSMQATAQEFPANYFDVQKIKRKPKTDNSYLYFSYGMAKPFLTKVFGDKTSGQTIEMQDVYDKTFAIHWYRNRGREQGGVEWVAEFVNWKSAVPIDLAMSRTPYSSDVAPIFKIRSTTESDFKSYKLGFASLLNNGIGLKLTLNRDIATLDGAQYGFWGCDYWFIFGGHPDLYKTRWAFSNVTGFSLALRKSINDKWLEDGIFEALTTFSLQRIAHTKGGALYVKLETSFKVRSMNMVIQEVPMSYYNAYYSEYRQYTSYLFYSTKQMVMSAGLSFGVLF